MNIKIDIANFDVILNVLQYDLNNYYICLEIMILGILLTLILILCLTFYYKCLVQPKKVMKWYQDTFEGLGYKVEYYEY